jgi:hypothetical protein
LGLYTLYDTNIHSSSTTPLSGPAFHFNPSILADYNTGIYDTSIYGNIDSEVYPTLNYENNTFNRQAGLIQKYSPLRDLTFTVQGDYTHSTNANVLVNSIPAPITSSASPPPAGAAGVFASQQTVVDPNDVYTATATVDKEFNRAFIKLGGTFSTTAYETSPLSNFNSKSYNGSGGFWFSPVFYAFGDGIQSFTEPAVGSGSNYFRARGGIGSAQIGLFQGSIYYGQQGSEVDYNGGIAGGDIYGGTISYYPTAVLNLSFGVDRQRNISAITSGSPQALGGLQLAAVGISPGESAEITTLSLRSNYTISDQTSAFAVVSDTLIDQIHGPPMLDSSWLASIGIRHQLTDKLTLNLDYSYTRYMSETPLTSFVRDLVTVGAVYRF